MAGDDEITDAAAAARVLLDTARDEARNGSLERSWRASREAAAIARRLGDGEILAEAATAMLEPSLNWRSPGARQALCLEALGMLGAAPVDGDEPPSRSEWRELVRLHLDGLSTGWAARPAPRSADFARHEGERRFAVLQSSYLSALGPAGLADRLALAIEAISLGETAGDDRYRAWGWHWRADALEQLGLREELDQAVDELFQAIGRMASPAWTWRGHATRANLALLDDRVDAVPELAERARRAGRDAGVDDAELFDLILRSALARRTGRGLDGIETEVRLMIVDAPAFARGWHAEVLLAAGRVEEAVDVYRTVAPTIGGIPEQVHEWLVGHVALVDLAVAAQDRESARALVGLLRPVAHLHAAGPVTTPYGGPVSLALAKATAFLGEGPESTAFAADAVARADAMRAPWYAAPARQLRASEGGFAPLSRREAEVANLVAEARTNREIASTLFLSERTVEQHVRSILHKLRLPNRAAIAAWVVAKR